VKHIQHVQPTGPYYVGGWSFGGILAFEVALQLEAAGNPPGGVVLIDADAPIAAYWRAEYAEYIQVRTRFEQTHGHNAAALGDVREPVLHRWQAIMGRQNQDWAVPRTTLHQIDYALQSLMTYQPGHMLNSPLIHIIARHAPPGVKTDWRNFTQHSIEQYELDGDHVSILRFPAVGHLTAIISDVLLQRIVT
jgi:thioesterase domain-containing protein